MSVFDDFQRMWMQKFPHSTLSDEWEHDVRASLQQHRDKITDLTKELEQETLYCEYLEQLLSDVEKLRSNDITTKNNGVNGGGVDSDSNKLGNLLNNDKNSQHQQQTTTTSANKTEVHKNGSGGGGGGGGGGENNVKNSSENVANNDKDNDENINNLIQLRRNGALNQCINELSTNLRRCISEVPSESNDHHKNSLETEDALKASRSRCNSLNEKQSPAKSPSHFITVIEVKEDNVASSNNNGAAVKKTNSKVSELRKCIENYEKGDEPTPKASELLASIQENKRKIPPRPPPKFVRRTGAAVDPPVVPRKPDDRTPDSSLERNVKPSDILRQKSNESLESSRSGGGGNKSHFENLSKAKSTELVEEFERRLIKSESLEKDKIKKSDSPTGSLGKISNDNLSNRSRGGASSATGSLDKAPYKGSDSLRTTDSKESLISDGATSDKIQKSYESVSSLGIDGLRNVEDVLEGEPYYDTVPTENNDETLPMPATRVHKNSGSQIDSESPGRHSNYVNIDYFLAHTNEANRESMDSDPEDGGVPPMLMRHISHDEYPSTPGQFRKLPTQSENRNTIIRHIISSIITSEQLYVQCLNKMVKYMKAINATLTTSQPVITKDEYQTIFFKIEDLYNVHNDFLIELVAQKEKSTLGGGDICVGGAFKTLAEHNHLYGAYLHNYGRAIDTVKKCGANNAQFKEIVSNIKLDSQNEASLSLEDLLHKPVARVQKNALVLQDLLNETPEDHFDYPALKEAQKIMRNFLSEFNFIHTKSIYPSEDKSLRRLIKNSFIVELADGHRKLRHLFLFNDVIACAKYKASGRDRFEFELKWFIPVKDIMFEDSIVEIKESNPWNILQLKSQACTVRDQIMLEEKDDKKTKFNGSSRVGDKHRKKLADLEGQLVLASPNLVFKLKNSATGKILTFFLSSDFEKSQWIESIESLKESCNLPGQNIVSIYELQAWIAACQNLIKTEMGSYLLRNNRDESLFVGDLHLTIQGLQSFDHPVDSFICIEVDSYGHYFRKAKTKLICRNSSPIWNESFVIELEGSQNLRILLYEDQPKLPALKAKSVLKLSRQWLTETSMNRTVNLTDKIQLSLILKFIPGEKTLRRVPTSKPGALFGAKMPQVLKREKRDTPFIISACIREVERRGMCEVGIYRVSGSASDLARLKKSFETNSYEAEQLLKEVDIHSVTGILKSYLRELPEALFTDSHYQYFFETFNKYSGSSEAARNEQLQAVFSKLPLSNQKTINMILDHLVRVHQQEVENKMSLHNLAMVFGPTLLRPGPQAVKQKDLLESSTVDVMAQAGILYCFLQARLLSKH